MDNSDVYLLSMTSHCRNNTCVTYNTEYLSWVGVNLKQVEGLWENGYKGRMIMIVKIYLLILFGVLLVINLDVDWNRNFVFLSNILTLWNLQCLFILYDSMLSIYNYQHFFLIKCMQLLYVHIYLNGSHNATWSL